MSNTNYIEIADRVRRSSGETMGKWMERAATSVLPAMGWGQTNPGSPIQKWANPGVYIGIFDAYPALRYEATRMQDALRDAGFCWEDGVWQLPLTEDCYHTVDFPGDALESTIAAYWFLQLTGGDDAR